VPTVGTRPQAALTAGTLAVPTAHTLARATAVPTPDALPPARAALAATLPRIRAPRTAGLRRA
jgi:hypothetical protein